jgi:hypothetical protein
MPYQPAVQVVFAASSASRTRLPWQAADYESTRELMHRTGHSTMRAALIYQYATDERAREVAEPAEPGGGGRVQEG